MGGASSSQGAGSATPSFTATIAGFFGEYGSVLYGTLISASGAFDYGIAGLGPSPADEPRTLCLRVHDVRSLSQRCGVRPGEAVEIRLDEPPRLLAPSISPDTWKQPG